MGVPVKAFPEYPLVLHLIEWGGIKAPTKVFGSLSGTNVEALIDAQGNFIWKGERFSSPSVAAGKIATLLTGQTTPGRNYQSVNGWKFWRVIDTDGVMRSLAEIRESVRAGAA